MTSRAYRATVRAGILLAAVLGFSQEVANPWPESAIVSPSDLAKTLTSDATKPAVICVAFPVLYRSKHIAGAVFAGPGNKPEGLDELKKAVAGLAKDSDLVLYCGCCPMTKCPNIRPAYRLLKEMGFTRVRVLSVPDSRGNRRVDFWPQERPGPVAVAAYINGHLCAPPCHDPRFTPH